MAADKQTPAAAPAAPSAAPLPPAEGRPVNTRALLILAAAVAAIALVAWMMVSSGRRKEEFATRELIRARAIAEQGNLPLAATELQNIIDTYGGTEAAAEAMVAINQVRLINGQSDLAAVSLREFLASNPAPKYRAPAEGLLAASLENAGQHADAAAAYRRASEAATVDYLKAEYLVDAGRALRNAGQPAEAEAAYRTVVTDFSETPSLTEAEVRLAEMTGGTLAPPAAGS